MATLYTEGFNSFVTSTAASVGTGRSEPVPGRDFHPLWTSAFSRRTELSGLVLPPPFSGGMATQFVADEIEVKSYSGTSFQNVLGPRNSIFGELPFLLDTVHPLGLCFSTLNIHLSVGGVGNGSSLAPRPPFSWLERNRTRFIHL